MKYQLFDPLPPDDFAALKADIRERGVLVPVEMDEHGDILDGHHRVQAWQELRTEGVNLADYPRMIRPGMSEEQKRNHVRALNLLRRHLPKEARAQVFADMRRDGMTLQQIAEVVGVNASTVKRNLDTAFANAKAEIPETTVGADGKTYPTTYKPRVGTPGIMAGGAKEQAKVESSLRLVDMNTGEIVGASEIIRSAAKVTQDEHRQEKRQQAQGLPDEVFNVVYADPAWEYNNTGLNGAAEHHYSTMSIEDIYGLPQQLNLRVADNAVLFLWATNPLLLEALECIRRWGFTYKTNLVWVKTELVKPGVGWYVRGRHELLLIATRGSFTPLSERISPPIGSVLEAPIQEHSRKPDDVYAIIERLYPECNYVELFARRAREGWTAWGDEVGA